MRLLHFVQDESNSKAEDARSSSHDYEYVSSEDVHPIPTTADEEVHTRISTSAVEEMTDEAIVSYRGENDHTSTQSEEEYDKVSGRPQTQPAPVYTSIRAAYENVSYPDA